MEQKPAIDYSSRVRLALQGSKLVPETVMSLLWSPVTVVWSCYGGVKLLWVVMWNITVGGVTTLLLLHSEVEVMICWLNVEETELTSGIQLTG